MRTLHSTFSSLRFALTVSLALSLPACGGGGDETPQDTQAGSGTDSQGTHDSGTGVGSGDPGTLHALGQTCENATQCLSGICSSLTYKDATTGQDVTVKTCSACGSNAECQTQSPLCAPTLSEHGVHYACSNGDLGGGCFEDLHCAAGRKCGETVRGVTTCGECIAHTDCTDPAKPLCLMQTPDNTGTVYLACSGALPDGELCSGKPDSDTECENYCAPAQLTLFPVPLSVCSICKDDSHCAANQTCAGPTIDPRTQTIQGGTCQDKPDPEPETTTGTETEMMTTTSTSTGEQTTDDMTTSMEMTSDTTMSSDSMSSDDNTTTTQSETSSETTSSTGT